MDYPLNSAEDSGKLQHRDGSQQGEKQTGAEQADSNEPAGTQFRRQQRQVDDQGVKAAEAQRKVEDVGGDLQQL